MKRKRDLRKLNRRIRRLEDKQRRDLVLLKAELVRAVLALTRERVP